MYSSSLVTMETIKSQIVLTLCYYSNNKKHLLWDKDTITTDLVEVLEFLEIFIVMMSCNYTCSDVHTFCCTQVSICTIWAGVI